MVGSPSEGRLAVGATQHTRTRERALLIGIGSDMIMYDRRCWLVEMQNNVGS